MADNADNLERAVHNIRVLIESNEGNRVPTVSHLEIKGNEIVPPKPGVYQRRSVELANYFFSFTKNENAPQNQVLKLLQEDIVEIGKALAKPENNSARFQAAKETALLFNNMLDRAKNDPKTRGEKAERFMNRSSGLLSVTHLEKIPLPPKYQLKMPTHLSYAAPLGDRKNISIEESPSNTSKKVSSFTAHVKTDLSKQTMDMYRMKAIRLLESHGLCSRDDARMAVMNFPIETKFSDSLCHISQNFPTVDGPSFRSLCIFSRESEAKSGLLSSDYTIFVSCSLTAL